MIYVHFCIKKTVLVYVYTARKLFNNSCILGIPPSHTHTHTHIFIRPLHTHTHSPAHHTHTQSRAPAHHTHTHSPAHTTHTQSCSEGMDELTGRLTELLKELDQLGSQMMEFRNGLKEQVDSILTAPHSPSPPTENLIDFTIKHT